MTGFHDSLGRLDGVAIADIIATLLLAELIIRFINRNNEIRPSVLRYSTYFFVFYLALITHLMLGIQTPLTKGLRI